MTVYLDTQHGSRLYGLATPESDDDRFTVRDERRRARLRDAKQTIKGKDDLVVVGLTTFLVNCDKAVPQYLEAMFSPVATVHPGFAAFRAGYMVNPHYMWKTYRRTAASFREQDTPKMRRHALRLLWNMDQGLKTGRFNPRLSEAQAVYLTWLCEDGRLPYDNVYEGLMSRWP